ncbi:MAG: condensation domain-containing protein, partial [Cyclobacteriaceae bacterium]
VLFGDHEAGQLLTRVFTDADVRAVKLTPSHISVLGELKISQSGVKTVILGGEALQPHHVSILRQLNPKIKIYNEYGPTETTVGCTAEEITGPSDLLIGTPVSNTRVFIIDKHGAILPDGVSGEIAVSGQGLSSGYLAQDLLTKERFVNIHLNNGESVKVYRTGDKGYRQADGRFVYLGRLDRQVKIRGYRVELGEIEQVAAEHPDVTDVYCVPYEKGAEQSVVLYYAGNDRPDESILRQKLTEQLPAYMVPAHLIGLESFPLTTNGKIDKERLPLPDDLATLKNYMAPSNDMEESLQEIWQEVLGLSQIGTDENFFSLGGDSIKAIRICNKAQEITGDIVHITALFEAPTIAGFAKSLSAYNSADKGSVDEQKIRAFRNIVASDRSVAQPEIKNKPAAFILSPPRSGSTLFRAILSGNPHLFAPPELELMHFNTLEERHSALEGTYGFFLEGTLRAIMELYDCNDVQAREMMAAWETGGTTTSEFYRILQKKLGDTLLIDKSPNYAFDRQALERIEATFREPKYIVLQRHPYGMIHSFESTKMDQIFRYKHDFTLRELAELCWLVSHQNIMDHTSTLPESRVHTVRYEDLVNRPEDTIKEVCRFLEVPFDPGMLNLYSDSQAKMLDGIREDSRMIGDVKLLQHSRIDPKGADKWRQVYDRDFLSTYTWDVATDMGYLPIHGEGQAAEILPVEPTTDYPVSSAQRRIWISSQMQEGNDSFVINAWRNLGSVREVILSKAFNALISRFEVLRTVFINVDGEPRQKVLHDHSHITLQTFDIRDRDDQETYMQDVTDTHTGSGFDLEKGPLLKALLFRTSDNTCYLFFSIHHIIADGWTMEVLYRDMKALYESFAMHDKNVLLPPEIQYKDYAQWEENQLNGTETLAHRDFWLQSLGGELPVLKLPQDHPRPAILTYDGKVATLTFNDTEARGIAELAKDYNTTLFTVFLSAFYALFYRYSGQKDIIIGTPFAGRNHPALENQIGVFINMLALRIKINPEEETFGSLLSKVRDHMSKAYRHQLYPFDRVVKELSLTKDPGRSPVFDVMYSFQNLGLSADISAEDVKALQGQDIETRNSKYDLTLIFSEFEKGILGSVKYNAQIYNKETIETLTTRLKETLRQVLEDPELRLDSIDYSTAEIAGTDNNSFVSQSFNTKF